MTEPLSPLWRQELEDCHRENAARIFAHIFLFTKRDKETSEDVVQETFHAATRAWERIREMQTDERRKWLFGTASHIAVDHFRVSQRARAHQAAVWERHYRLPPDDTVRLALTGAALEHCWKVIERMPPRQHVVALLRWRCGYANGEIAEMLGISAKTVSAHVSAARGMLIGEARPYLPFDLADPEGGLQP